MRAFGTSLVVPLLVCCQLPAAEPDRADTLGPAPAGSFSIAVIPDTQAYRGPGVKNPQSGGEITNSIFEAHTRWIAENVDSQRIAFVSHVGDIVDKNVPGQWEVAKACMDRLRGRVPYGISVGNHDMTAAGDSTLFQRYFPASRFAGFDWYGGTFQPDRPETTVSGNNANSYQLFSASGIDWIFLHLECNAPDDVLAWANDLLAKHRDRKALITTHMGLGPRDKPKENRDYIEAPKGMMRWSKIHGKRGNTPEQLWEKCYRRHRNLVAVFSGDQSRSQALNETRQGDHGNPVHLILSDYSTGWLRLVRFLPAEKRIDVVTFDPKTGELCTGTKLVPNREQHQYSLPFDPNGK